MAKSFIRPRTAQQPKRLAVSGIERFPSNDLEAKRILEGAAPVRRLRILLGLALWAGGIGALLWTVDRAAGSAWKPAASVVRHLLTPSHEVHFAFDEEIRTRPGDAVCLRQGREVVLVGQVRRIRRRTGESPVVTVALFPDRSARVTQDAEVRLVYNHRTPTWVVRTLFPPPLRAEICQEIGRFFRENRESFFEAVWPDVREMLRGACTVLEEDLEKALESRSKQVGELVDRHREETFKKRLLPVLREEAWPVLKKDAAPLLDRIGEELWKELPMWGLGWRWFAEKVPFTDDDLVRKRFEEYVEEEALPILESHTEAFVDLASGVFAQLARNPRVTRAVKSCVTDVASDRAFLALLESLFREVVLDNPRLHDCIVERMKRKSFLEKIGRFAERLNPLLCRVANRILLNEKGDALNPELVRVLRTQLFWKDTSWFLVEPGTGLPAGRGHVFKASVFRDD
jgi:hypothetical protein